MFLQGVPKHHVLRESFADHPTPNLPSSLLTAPSPALITFNLHIWIHFTSRCLLLSDAILCVVIAP